METVYEEDYDMIRTFLKIGSPKIEEKSYYEVDLEKNIILLHDPIFKNKSDNSDLYEVNQIFTNKHQNSYIYEQICQNTISESLNGDSFVFISYGTTISEKLEMLIGNIENSNRNPDKVGIFPRLLNQLINKINNSKDYTDNLSINLSYICVYDNKLIDLSNYLGKNYSNYNADKFIKDGLNIDNIEIIKKVKKVPTENYNDVLFFINKILLYLRKLEDDSNGQLFSKSYITIIIYITNNEGKQISKLVFILLNGSEQLNDDKQNKLNKGYISNIESKKILNQSKMALDTQYTYNSILYAIKNNESIARKKVDHNKLNEDNLNLVEQKNLSKLTKVLFYPCFSRKIKNIKFVIIGSIMPLPGVYSSVKDTLLFLFECRKIKSNINKNLKFSESLRKSKRIQEEDDIIFNLEEKIKLQEMKIADLNKNIDDKIQNITALEKNYKYQINLLKDYFGFEGDINILLSGHEFSPEMRRAKEIKESIDTVRILKLKIKELEDKLYNANEEIKKYNNIKEIQINNKTMINYYYGSKKIQEDKINKDNDLYIKIDKYKNELKTKEKIIQELKNDLDTKNNILINMPKFLKELQESKIEQEKKKEIEKAQKEKEKEENNDIFGEEEKSKEQILSSKIIEQKEYLSMLKSKDKEMNEMKKRYENILAQKEKIILDMNNELNILRNKNSKTFNKYEDELYKLNELFMSLLNNYQRIFLSSFTEKCNPVTIFNKKLQYDHILLSIKKDYDIFSFPLLYGILAKKGKKIKTNLNSASLRKGSNEKNYPETPRPKLILLNNNSYINFSENLELSDVNKFNDDNKEYSDLNDINSFIKKEIKINNIILNEKEIEKIEKEKIINEYRKTIKLISDIQDFISKIIKIFDRQNNKNNINILEYEKQIKNYKNKVEKISNNLDKEIYTNNKNKIIINSQNRLIEKLQQDLIYKDIPEYKMKLNKKVNKNINLSINKIKDKDYLKIVNDNSSFNLSQNIKKNNRGFSSKIRRIDTEGSSGMASLIQKTNNSFLNNNSNTYINFNTPIRLKTEGNKY